jgi:hypothetical protein
VVTADDVTRGKPEPETFLLAITKSGGNPEESLVVEDSEAAWPLGPRPEPSPRACDRARRFSIPRFLGAFPDVASLTRLLLEPSR